MNFSEFLKKRRAKKNIATAKDHYEELGGEKALGIALRQFQLIESGKYAPSERLLTALFAKTPPSEKKDLVLAYFKSVFTDDEKAATPLLSYLEQHLSPAVESESKSLWETTKLLMTYSEAQLKFLTEDPETLRFHRKVLLLEGVPKKACRLPPARLKAMLDLDLIAIVGDEIRPSRTLYRIPHYENSAPRAVGAATDYILKHLELYSAREGSPSQELAYATQLVRKDAAEKIVEQMKAFKRWVQSLAASGVDKELTPLVFVGFVRNFDRRELD